MVVDRRPDRNVPVATGRPAGEGLSFESDFAVDGNLVYCKLQVTELHATVESVSSGRSVHG